MMSGGKLLRLEKSRLKLFGNEIMDPSEQQQSGFKGHQDNLKNFKVFKRAFPLIINGKYNGQCNENQLGVNKNVQTMLVGKLERMIQSLEEKYDIMRKQYMEKGKSYIYDRSRAMRMLTIQFSTELN